MKQIDKMSRLTGELLDLSMMKYLIMNYLHQL